MYFAWYYSTSCVGNRPSSQVALEAGWNSEAPSIVFDAGELALSCSLLRQECLTWDHRRFCSNAKLIAEDTIRILFLHFCVVPVTVPVFVVICFLVSWNWGKETVGWSNLTTMAKTVSWDPYSPLQTSESRVESVGFVWQVLSRETQSPGGHFSSLPSKSLETQVHNGRKVFLTSYFGMADGWL